MKRLTTKFRTVTAGFTKVSGDDAAVQLITDSMANSLNIQLEYEGSGWRTVLPYGWNTSAAGDLLVMCYKDGMEIRSYRLDRVIQLYVDDVLLDADAIIEQSEYEPSQFVIPQLPDIDAVLELSESERGDAEPFADAVEQLENYDQTGVVEQSDGERPADEGADAPDDKSDDKSDESVDEELNDDEPKVDEPKVDEPKVDEPKVDEPKVDEPVNNEQHEVDDDEDNEGK